MIGASRKVCQLGCFDQNKQQANQAGAGDPYRTSAPRSGFLCGGFLRGGFLRGGFLRSGFLRSGFLRGRFLSGGIGVQGVHELHRAALMRSAAPR